MSVNDAFKNHELFVEKVWGPVSREYVTFVVDETRLTELGKAFDEAKTVLSGQGTKGEEYISSTFGTEIYSNLNREYIYRDCTNFAFPVGALLDEYYEEILNAVGSPFCAVNIRAWTTIPDATEFGPSAWHTDGFCAGHLKLMIYLEGLGGDLGSIEFEGVGGIEGPRGLAVLFRNSDISHRAVPAKSSNLRPVIEVTLQRVLRKPASQFPRVGDNNDRHLSNPFLAYSIST